MIALGVWQLRRAEEKEALIDRYRAAQNQPPISFPTAPIHSDQLPLFRYSTGVCLRPVSKRSTAGQNRSGEPGYVHIVECSTGAEGPGMSVEVGWSKNPNVALNWRGGPVSGIIAPTARRACGWSPPPLAGARAERSAVDRADSKQHRSYAPAMVPVALIAVAIYISLCARIEGRGSQGMTAELHRLANGLSVALDPLPGAESVALGLYARVGSRSEPQPLSGLAHLVEHMVFKGAGGRDTRALAEAIEDVGGHLNAWTSRDQTAFHGRALAKDLPLVAELIADLVRAPHFDQEHLEREKQVILSELGECVDSPDDLVHDHLFEAAFDGQAIGRSVSAGRRGSGHRPDDCFGWLSSSSCHRG